ncbi:DUF3109 family protein [bacterium]|nr:DUF3109 family protein [Akkermansiaceae bacterium]MDB4585013.1 DUF3109 family protein [bacterium]MDB4570735.1 DUF3109 family protein [Akkermansiaceae bacterium]MDB4615698.1 DUF3109 family protein [Akkermansiaceae bacterium]MDB4644066.1 DUF3109 family protein [bacterium]
MTVSAFPKTIGALAGQLREAGVDHDAFEIPLPLCQLSECRATCCHDGVFLSSEEAAFIGEGVETLSDGRQKTATVPATPEHRADDFPAHFPETRCVFLDDEHRCKWQLKSVEEGKHPWFYKPISCWMHPILLERREGRPILTLRTSGNDAAGFASQTPCGRLTQDADPARVTLKAELEMLGSIAQRDFSAELNAPSL